MAKYAAIPKLTLDKSPIVAASVELVQEEGKVAAARSQDCHLSICCIDFKLKFNLERQP